ncbi:MAG: cytochrome c [Candidatus Sulfotelmatobacter sp.]
MKLGCLAAVVIVFCIFSAAQEQSAQKPSVTVKHVPIARTSASSGKEMFNNYCAVCHGTDGKGAGPAASALKTPPPDLTALAQKSGGKYPSAHVASVIRGQASMPSHGSQDMPVWGPLFSSISQGHESQVQQRVANLVEYIGTLQAK